jgi:spore coat-associated protein N
MKNIKKVLIGTALAGSLVVGAGYGTYSWFTAETSATGTIDNGTFALGDMGANLFNQVKFAPSRTVDSDLKTIDNTGSLNQILKVTYNQKITGTGGAALSANQSNAVISKYKVYYFALKYQEKPKKEVIIDARDNILKHINGTPNVAVNRAAIADPGYEVVQGELSDQEVQSLMAAKQGSPTEKTFTLGNGDKDTFWTLTPKQHIDIQFFVKLADNAGNEFQGIHYDGTFKVEAKQTDQGAKFPSELNGN